MKLPHSLAELQKEHVVMELECIDRMYLNGYVPQLTSEAGIAWYCREYLGYRLASTRQAVDMTERFVASIQEFVAKEGLELVRFEKGQRKDEVMQAKLRRFRRPEGVVFVGVAQEKMRVPRTTRKQTASGGTIPWIRYTTAMVNAYYFYCLDRDFGPFFLKFCSYFPYGAKVCLNGHEYLKRQLAQRGIAIRENIDLGRPEQVQLIFARTMRRKTATDGRCRTRIITEGVVPSLHVYYKNTHLKQYHKEGRGLRTETTINDTYDFGVGKRLHNLAALRAIGMAANRRVLEVEQLTHDCHIGAEAFDRLQQPAEVDGQHASALPFGQPWVQALLTVLVLFCLQPEGFRNRQLRPLLAQLLGLPEAKITPGRLSYELRRLRLHGIIERIPQTQRYRLTAFGLKTASFSSWLTGNLSWTMAQPGASAWVAATNVALMSIAAATTARRCSCGRLCQSWRPLCSSWPRTTSNTRRPSRSVSTET
jgi:hypothetical protein